MGWISNLTDKFIRSTDVYKSFEIGANEADKRKAEDDRNTTVKYLNKKGIERTEANIKLYMPEALAEANKAEGQSGFGAMFSTSSEQFIKERGEFAEKYVPILASAAVGGLAAGGMITAQAAKGITAANSKVFASDLLNSPLKTNNNILTDQPGYDIIPQSGNQNDDALLAAYLASQTDQKEPDQKVIIIGVVIVAIAIVFILLK